MAAGDVAAGDVAAGDVAAGDVAAGDVAAGDVAAGDVAADPERLAVGSVRSIYQRVMDRARNEREVTTGHSERFRFLAMGQFPRVAAVAWTRRRCPATVR
jgi:hypothetical protein